MTRCTMLQTFSLAVAGTALGAVHPPSPAYFNFFGAPVRPDRYTRNIAALTASRGVEEPSLSGGHSLEMEFRFSGKNRFGILLWDLAPVHLSRVRFHVFNPNPSRLEITLKTTLADTERRQWLLESEGRPLRSGRWTKVDVRLDAHAVEDAVFLRMILRFEVRRDFPAFGDPLLLYVDGVELF